MLAFQVCLCGSRKRLSNQYVLSQRHLARRNERPAQMKTTNVSRAVDISYALLLVPSRELS